ncbi:DNA-binding transcription factor yap1 [Entomortierella chlamydospora]|uniref:DNA-binding transcription factor yap1 n=1 Tax=Entomortierella chlamydospora TaxID=101097 RepID=A0A9P6T5L9_9FUNG|nr:DNA-binding transcription factor yap1 [Entomortierella chlamydospora]KAG0024536.1 DNA-binding transcription factor yap1 [Entomortierella chlamydospora]
MSLQQQQQQQRQQQQLQLQQQLQQLQSTTVFTEGDWSALLHSNTDAQDLLSDAIAHHHSQYTDSDHNKRNNSHLHHKSDHYDSTNDSAQYSEGDNSSDETKSRSDGKPAPKKAGRKPLTTEPTNKRKAQNRAAQRAFRERKERYVKSLEDRIKELEDSQPKSNSTLKEENLNLKVLVQKLETENYFLKERSFTFNFPITQPGIYNATKSRQNTTVQNPSPVDSNIDSSLKSPGTSSNVASSDNIGGDPLPWTPPSSSGESVPNSPANNDLTASEQDSLSQASYPDTAGVVPKYNSTTPEAAALFSSLDGLGNTYHRTGILSFNNSNHSSGSSTVNSDISSIGNPATSIAGTSDQIHATIFGSNSRNNYLKNGGPSSLDAYSPASTLALFSDNSPSPAVEDLVNSPLSLFDTDGDGNVRLTPSVTPISVPSFTYEQTQALFMDFRDPSDPINLFSGFDDKVETVFPEDTVGGMFSSQLLDYPDPFVNLSSNQTKEDPPQGTTSEPPSPTIKHTLPMLGENEQAIPCPQAWEQIAKHPKFDDADIDELCAELKSKAKCSGHGPVIAQSDVDKLMSKLDQE